MCRSKAKKNDIVLVKWLFSQGLSSGPAAPGPADCWWLLPWPDQWWWAGRGSWPERCPAGSWTIQNLLNFHCSDSFFNINSIFCLNYLNLKGNLKQFLRLTVASRPPLPVLGIKKAILDKAGLPDFASVLREGGYQAMDSKNTRLAEAKADHKLCVLYLLCIGFCMNILTKTILWYPTRLLERLARPLLYSYQAKIWLSSHLWTCSRFGIFITIGRKKN